jgi:glutamate carboxypeptidase
MTAIVDGLRARQADMVEALAAITRYESPSHDHARTTACADVIARIGQELLGVAPVRETVDQSPYLRWTFGTPRVLLLGHLDTVWPAGTLDRWPFEVEDGIASGPGVFDMKAGLVQLLFALSVMSDLNGIEVLVTSDEEIGSPASRPLIESRARFAEAVLVLEASAGGALKTARKGVSMYTVEVHGLAAHAGLEPELGVNATVELARQVLRIADLADPALGTTVTPTVIRAGEVANQIPAYGQLHVDVRACGDTELQRVDAAMQNLIAVEIGASIVMRGGINRPALSAESSGAIFRRAAAAAHHLGLSEIAGVAVGGASDGNFSAAIGVPTLDGLGAVGGGAHAEGEHVQISAMPERAALLAVLATDLLSSP